MERALTPGAVNDTQLALAEALFLAQLGGVEVVQTAKGQTGSYFLGAEATVTEPFAHGGRVAFLLPADTDFRALRPCPAVQHFALRKADGTVLRRRARESEHPVRQYSADLADKHIYLRPYKGGEGRYAALTLGIQSDAPGGVSPLGHTHSDWAHSERQSGFLSCRETGVGQRIGGRIIDLTPLSGAQLTALMQAFAHGYRALQAQPEVPDALLRVGSLLTGAPLTREEMLALWSHLDADDAEALGAAFDACRSRSLEAPIKPPQLKTGDGCTFAPLTPVHIELRQNEVNWYNRVFGWLPFVDSANDIRRENRRLQNEYRAAQRASDLSFGGNPFEDEIEYSDAVLKPRYRLHRCGLPKERLAIPGTARRTRQRAAARPQGHPVPAARRPPRAYPGAGAFPYLCQGAVRRAAHRGRISRQESECARQKPAQQPGLVCPDYHADHLQRCPPQRHRPPAEPRARADRTRAAPP